MSNWTCLNCGTHNTDPFDDINTANMDHPQVQKYMKQKEEYENRGEMIPMYCTRCRRKRD